MLIEHRDWPDLQRRAVIRRIVAAKYQRGAAFNRQHPSVEVLFSDMSGETLDLRESLPPEFHRVTEPDQLSRRSIVKGLRDEEARTVH